MEYELYPTGHLRRQLKSTEFNRSNEWEVIYDDITLIFIVDIENSSFKLRLISQKSCVTLEVSKYSFIIILSKIVSIEWLTSKWYRPFSTANRIKTIKTKITRIPHGTNEISRLVQTMEYQSHSLKFFRSRQSFVRSKV